MIFDAVATHGRARALETALVELETGRSWSWAALDADVNRAANWLIARLGPASGARVAMLARNRAEMLLLQFGCARAGAMLVPLNWRLAPLEIAALLADAEPALLIHDAEFGTADFGGATLDAADLSGLLADVAATPPSANARRGWEEASTILYTSGTSGRPKGVMVSEANAFWGSTNFILGNGVSSASVFLCDMPLFHTAGLFANSRTPIQAGGKLLLSQGFDPAVTLARLADPALGITHYFSVPQMARALSDQPGFAPAMLRGLQVYAMGGAPNPPAQIERFVSAGVAMSDGFGMSETCSNFGMPVGDRALLLAKAGSCGLPYAALEVRLVDAAGDDVAPGAPGELWLRGPGVTHGYWRQPELTAETFHEGWFRTGDIARRDADGYYFIVDRRKDMFISGGENVYPAEVEAVLAEIEDIAEVAVVGAADDRWGQVGHAYVIPRAGVELDLARLRAHCVTRLARYKVPARFVRVGSLPRTASGKLQRHLLSAGPNTGLPDGMAESGAEPPDQAAGKRKVQSMHGAG